MSVLVPELERVVERIAVIAPTPKKLRGLFETLSFDLTTRVGVGQKLDIAMAAPASGPVRALCSFTLGRRAGSSMRISMLGYDLETPALDGGLFGIADSILLWTPEGEALCERLLSMKVPDAARERPCVVAGLLKAPPEGPSLRSLALIEWARRHFANVHHIQSPETYFAEGMEWALSF